mgnify:CR=1 FL=1
MLEYFLPKTQLEILQDTDAEEGRYFQIKLQEITNTINTMPKTHETDGQGDRSISYLHYFHACGGTWITEKDIHIDPDQAFGYINIGIGGELGYISIKERIHIGFELDLYCTPTAIKAIK